jgi:LAS superfamily LD-carboxypeptidase LdcB
MFKLTPERIYQIIICIALIVISAYGINYQIARTVKKELLRLRKKEYGRIKQQQEQIRRQQMRQQMNQMNEQEDVDSYVNPAEGYDNDQQYDYGSSSGRRLSQNDIMQRDIMGG